MSNLDIGMEAFNLFCGKLLGQGIDRKTFVLATDPAFVVKVEEDERRLRFQNILEWQVWCAATDVGKEATQWLAPCVHLSPDGRILIQRRTQPLILDKRPKKMPVWLSDFKADNYGMLDGRVVAHDYGLNMPLLYGLYSKAKRIANWY